MIHLLFFAVTTHAFSEQFAVCSLFVHKKHRHGAYCKVIITKLKLDKDRKALLERKMGNGAEKGKGKFTEDEVKAMQDVD